MRSNSIPSLLALLAGLSSVHALVNVYVQNKCPYDIYPVAHNTELTEVYKGDARGTGESWTFTVPDTWASGLIYATRTNSGVVHPDGSTDLCMMPDGVGCTRVECTFVAGASDWCNISTIKGYSDPVTFQWACQDQTTTCDGEWCTGAYTPDAPNHNPCIDCIKNCVSDFLKIWYCY